jgi:FkbM family methyltransferase
MKKNNLIFDFGFHNGDDTDFYLKKGFNVISIEANPILINKGIKRFSKYISEKKLILINKAINNKIGLVKFYIHLTKSDWSSCDQNLAESDGSKSKEINIETTSLLELCKNFGIPRYIKVDIEGCDVMVAKQLFYLEEKPQFVSFEISKSNYYEIFSWLFVSGYKKFQLVNQLNNPSRKQNDYKVFEKKKIEYNFTKYSSGFFGNDLSNDKWLSYERALSFYMKYKELKIIDNKELALGWLDLHASL